MENNQFNFLRLFAAFLVFYGHGLIFLGHIPNTILGHKLGVYIFFAISGYLISMSWDREPNIVSYFIKRALRIFPALVVVVSLSVLLLGPLLTTLPLKEYFANEHTIGYFSNIILYVTYYLPGVFESLPVPNAVNGSLWSLPVEFLMYILVAVLGVFFRGKMTFVAPLLFLILAYFTISWALVTEDFIVVYGINIKSIIYTSVYFWAGATIYHLNLKRFFSFESFVLVFLVLIFLYQWKQIFNVALLFFLPFLVLCFGLSKSQKLSFFNKADYSYGLYIYAFPVQQTLVFLFPQNGLLFHLSIGFFITLLLSALSWHYIEKPMLSLKPKSNK